jgi:hypothetical protein
MLEVVVVVLMPVVHRLLEQVAQVVAVMVVELHLHLLLLVLLLQAVVAVAVKQTPLVLDKVAQTAALAS